MVCSAGNRDARGYDCGNCCGLGCFSVASCRGGVVVVLQRTKAGKNGQFCGELIFKEHFGHVPLLPAKRYTQILPGDRQGQRLWHHTHIRNDTRHGLWPHPLPRPLQFPNRQRTSRARHHHQFFVGRVRVLPSQWHLL